jgi:hypothetical protein
LLVDQQGSTEAYLGAYLGFTDRMMFILAQAGLITVRHEIINTGAELIDIGRVRITDAGRRALEDMTARRPSPRLQPGEWLPTGAFRLTIEETIGARVINK